MGANDENIPFFSSGVGGSSLPQTAKPSTQDEQDFGTLQAVHKLLKDGIDNLYKDFNAFNLIGDKGDLFSKEDIRLQIMAKQIAFDVLSEPLSLVESTLEQVNAIHRS